MNITITTAPIRVCHLNVGDSVIINNKIEQVKNIQQYKVDLGWDTMVSFQWDVVFDSPSKPTTLNKVIITTS